MDIREIEMPKESRGFVAQLNAWQLANGLSNAQMADRLGVSYSSLMLWRQGKYLPSARYYTQLANAVGTTPQEIALAISKDTGKPIPENIKYDLQPSPTKGRAKKANRRPKQQTAPHVPQQPDTPETVEAPSAQDAAPVYHLSQSQVQILRECLESARVSLLTSAQQTAESLDWEGMHTIMHRMEDIDALDRELSK